MKTTFELDRENATGIEVERPEIEGTRLTPSELESIYHDLIRAGIDPLTEEPRILTRDEILSIREDDLDRERAGVLCHSIMDGIKMQTAFELSCILFLSRAYSATLETLSFGHPGFDADRYAQPQPWLISALYPTRNGEDKMVRIEAFSGQDASYTRGGPAGYLDTLRRVFLAWHQSHVFFDRGKKKMAGSDGALLPAAEVELLWNTHPYMSREQIEAVREGNIRVFPMYETSLDQILRLAHAIFYYKLPDTGDITTHLRRARGLEEISFEPSVQISIHRTTEDRDTSNTLLARTDLAIANSIDQTSRNGRGAIEPVTVHLVDIKTGAQMDEAKLASPIARVTALAYALSYYFTRAKLKGIQRGLPRRVILEDEVLAFLANTALKASHEQTPGNQPGVFLSYLHLPTGNARNMFPGAFLDPKLYSQNGNGITAEDIRRELMSSYELMVRLFEFARLNKNHSRFWKRSTRPFVLPRPVSSQTEQHERIYQPRLELF